MNRVFYRYIRPISFDPKRMDFNTQPRGGVCLRFEKLGETDDVLFTYSRCHPDDHFSKSVAKKVADHRAGLAKTDVRLAEAMAPNMNGIEEDSETLTCFLIAYCREFDASKYPFLISHYLAIEWLGFADALERIMRHNQREKEIARIWQTAAGAMEMAEAYKNHVPANG